MRWCIGLRLLFGLGGKLNIDMHTCEQPPGRRAATQGDVKGCTHTHTPCVVRGANTLRGARFPAADTARKLPAGSGDPKDPGQAISSNIEETLVSALLALFASDCCYRTKTPSTATAGSPDLVVGR